RVGGYTRLSHRLRTRSTRASRGIAARLRLVAIARTPHRAQGFRALRFYPRDGSGKSGGAAQAMPKRLPGTSGIAARLCAAPRHEGSARSLLWRQAGLRAGTGFGRARVRWLDRALAGDREEGRVTVS